MSEPTLESKIIARCQDYIMGYTGQPNNFVTREEMRQGVINLLGLFAPNSKVRVYSTGDGSGVMVEVGYKKPDDSDGLINFEVS